MPAKKNKGMDTSKKLFYFFIFSALLLVFSVQKVAALSNNGTACSSGASCSSNNCNCGLCAPAGGCGSGYSPGWVSNGGSASGTYGSGTFSGTCVNGVWKIDNGRYGCNLSNPSCSPGSFSCNDGYKCSGGTNGQCLLNDGGVCSSGSQCSSGVCDYCFCVPAQGYCGSGVGDSVRNGGWVDVSGVFNGVWPKWRVNI